MSAPSASAEMTGKADVKPAVREEFVTLVVTDEEGRRLTRTLRRSDQLQVLMDFYYSMVPTVKHGEGVFNYRGVPLSLCDAGTITPACFTMKDADEIRFFPEIQLVTPVLRDLTGRSFTRTMRTTDQLQVLMDFYHDMVPAAGVSPGIFLFCGVRVKGEQTPAAIGMKDWDRIYAVPTVRGEVGQEKQSDDYITLKVENYFLQGQNSVYRTMRPTEKVMVLMQFYYATLPAVSAQDGSFMFYDDSINGIRLSGQDTPAQVGMKDGDKVDHVPTMYGCC